MRPAAHAFPSSHPASRVPDALDAELNAFNAAFDELDLDWRWDRAVIEELAPAGDDRARVAVFLQRRCAHLLKVYDEGFLVELIVAAKARRDRNTQ